jgi:hypothetical protein
MMAHIVWRERSLKQSRISANLLIDGYEYQFEASASLLAQKHDISAMRV